jgi:hypothetical protein
VGGHRGPESVDAVSVGSPAKDSGDVAASSDGSATQPSDCHARQGTLPTTINAAMTKRWHRNMCWDNRWHQIPRGTQIFSYLGIDRRLRHMIDRQKRLVDDQSRLWDAKRSGCADLARREDREHR